MLGILDCTQTVLLLQGLGGNVGRFTKWVWSGKAFIKLWRKKVCLCESECVSGTWCTYECGMATVQRHLTSQYFDDYLYVVSGKRNHMKHDWKGSRQPPVSQKQTNLQLSPPRDGLLDCRIIKQTTAHHQLHTRLNWKRRNQIAGFWLERQAPPSKWPRSPWETWIRRWGYQMMCVCWLDTWLSSLSECAKQFSTWVLTIKPQPAIITSKTKALLLPSYFRYAAFDCQWNNKEIICCVSRRHYHHCFIFPLDPPPPGMLSWL